MAEAEQQVTFSDNGEWVFVGRFPHRLAIYPRDDGSYSIGKSVDVSSAIDVETGFANIQAAIDHASWMVADEAADYHAQRFLMAEGLYVGASS